MDISPCYFFLSGILKEQLIIYYLYNMANDIVDKTRDETNDRINDVIDHFDEVNKKTFDLLEKLSRSTFKIARDVHEDIADRQKDKKDK